MMNGLLIKLVYGVLIGLTLFMTKYSDDKIECDAIRISAVDNYEIISGTRTYIPLSALSNDLENLVFHLEKGPDFISLNKTQRGRAELVLDPTAKEKGSYDVRISVENGKKYGCVRFKINVIKFVKSNIIHCSSSGNNDGDGSLENPYGMLNTLLESGFEPKKNSVLMLHNGNHGNVTLKGGGYSILVAANSTARLNSLHANGAQNIKVSGIVIEPKAERTTSKEYLIYIDSTSSNIEISNNKIQSIEDSEGWSIADWKKMAFCGVKCLADDSYIRNNTIQNVFHGIKTEGKNIKVSFNHVDRFGGDAVRNTGSYNSYKSNFLSNATIDDYYAEDGNHDDLFQSWTFDKPIVGIQLSGNVMISVLDTIMPLRSKVVQGLVCFDGFEKEWLVKNNLVVTDHPHGIALYGAENCRVIENTVLRNPHHLYEFESNPWIMINKHKDGRSSNNNEVSKNIASAYVYISDQLQKSDNIELDTTYNYLKNYYEWDFRVKK